MALHPSPMAQLQAPSRPKARIRQPGLAATARMSMLWVGQRMPSLLLRRRQPLRRPPGRATITDLSVPPNVDVLLSADEVHRRIEALADQLAPTEAPTFAMTTGVDNMKLDAGLSGVISRSWNTSARLIAAETNKKGLEPQVAFWGFRQALDSDPANVSTYGKLRQYNVRAIQSMKVTVNPNGGAQTLSDQTYSGVMTPTKSSFWGETFTTGTWGCTEAAMVRGNFNYPPIPHFYLGTQSIGTFPLSYSPVAGDSTSLTVLINGSVTVPGSVTYGSNPAFSLTAVTATGDKVAAFVQTADAF